MNAAALNQSDEAGASDPDHSSAAWEARAFASRCSWPNRIFTWDEFRDRLIRGARRIKSAPATAPPTTRVY